MYNQRLDVNGVGVVILPGIICMYVVVCMYLYVCIVCM